MIRIGDLALAFLLLVTTFSGYGDAARSREQRRAVEDPYLVSPPGVWPNDNVRPPSKDLGERVFTLRHMYHHGTHLYPNLHRYKDVPKNAQLYVADEFGLRKEAAPKQLRAKVLSTNIQRMADRRRSTIENIFNYAAVHGEAMSLPASAWTVDEIPGPNHTDKGTVITFAKMAANAYVEEPWTGEWRDVKGGFNYTDHFGWEQDGLRGHIFADETNKTIVIGLKGTSMALFDGAETTGNDKLNDNLFGSCCCGQGGPYMWKKACDCMSSAYTCNSTCVVQSLYEKNHYYWAVKDLYHNVTERYPDADVWLSGHSLGGVVSTLLALTEGLPVLTFEAFPDALAASRLGLPVPPGYHIGSHQSRTDVAIHHYGHTADPVFMGSCNGASSLCTIGGYAFESQCHTGKTCIYDTVGDLGWRASVGTHRITSVITDVLEKYDEVPVCEEDTECTDCYVWKFFKSNGSETTTSSSSTSTATRTRTETCKTPGWWGCLDETTTSTGTTSPVTTTSDSSSSTSTCETPGWFGCKDPTTTTSSSTVSSSTASPAPTLTSTSSPATSTSTCETPGWFGCNDPTSTTPSATPAPTSTSTSAPPTSTRSCETPGWFGCKDPTTTTSTSKPSSTNLPTTRRKCVRRHWYGTCKEWTWGLEEFKSDL